MVAIGKLYLNLGNISEVKVSDTLHYIRYIRIQTVYNKSVNIHRHILNKLFCCLIDNRIGAFLSSVLLLICM